MLVFRVSTPKSILNKPVGRGPTTLLRGLTAILTMNITQLPKFHCRFQRQVPPKTPSPSIPKPRKPILNTGSKSIRRSRSKVGARSKRRTWPFTTESVDSGCWGVENSRILSLMEGRKPVTYKYRNVFLKMMTTFFQVTFWSPKWRSLNPWKGHLNHPKRSLGGTWDV